MGIRNGHLDGQQICCHLLFLNSELCIWKVYNLISFNICIYLLNYYHNVNNEHMHSCRKFPCASLQLLIPPVLLCYYCLLYTSDAADDQGLV